MQKKKKVSEYNQPYEGDVGDAYQAIAARRSGFLPALAFHVGILLPLGCME
jgi:hypothetical protein